MVDFASFAVGVIAVEASLCLFLLLLVLTLRVSYFVLPMYVCISIHTDNIEIGTKIWVRVSSLAFCSFYILTDTLRVRITSYVCIHSLHTKYL